MSRRLCTRSLILLHGILILGTGVAPWGASSLTATAEDWPQWRGIGRDAKINDDQIARSLPEGPVERRWAAPVGPGYSGPTVSEGRVYLTDRQGEVPNVEERVLCFDAQTGNVLWQHIDPVAYEISYQASGPRASVTISDGFAFAVGGMGRMSCLDANSGDLIWTRDLNQDYEIRMPVWGITAAPLVYQDMVIQVVGGAGDACVVAFDRKTGVESWKSLDERAGYSAPVLIRQGDQDVLAVWTGESISGLNPQSGELFWSVPMPPRKMPIGVPTPVINGRHLFVSSFYDGAMLIEIDPDRPAAKKLWHRVGQDEKNTDALHAMISGPLIKGGHIYGADSYGEFRCLDLNSGDRIWENLTVVPRDRWATVHTIQNGEDEIMLNEKGELLMVTLSPDGIEIRSRSPLIKPTKRQLNRRGGVIWSHPAIADGMIYARNDEELVCGSIQKSN